MFVKKGWNLSPLVSQLGTSKAYFCFLIRKVMGNINTSMRSLTEEQKEAVLATEGRIRVVAPDREKPARSSIATLSC